MKVKKLFKGSTILVLILLSIINISCSKDDEQTLSQEIVDYENSGILGGVINIKGKNLEFNKIQVFFDYEEAFFLIISEDEIEVSIPRSIKRYNPVLKIINLVTNEDILNETFTLNAPIINSFNSDKITFNEKLIIIGENFDNQKDYLQVFVNDERAEILNTTHNQVEIYIPNNITDASLNITVKAQLQTTNTSPQLKLKNPEIMNITNDFAWLGKDLFVEGSNFNPESEYGEVFINGNKAYFSSSNTGLVIDVPYGPYSDFEIVSIVYKTAGLESTYELNLEIKDVGIMVDRMPNIQGSVIIYNDKAYGFAYEDSSNNVALYEFSPDTEKWTKIESFGYDGYLSEVVFDNKDAIYIYKTVSNNTHELSKLDLSTLTETTINIPFHQSLNGATILVYQNDLFVLNGITYENDQSIESDKRYRYISAENRWEEILTDLFSGNEWKRGSISTYIYLNGNLHFSNFDGNYKLENNAELTQLYGDNLLFRYNQAIISKNDNGFNGKTVLYDIFDPLNRIELYFGRFDDYLGTFFTINDEIFYGSLAVFYDGAVERATYKIKKEELNELL